MSKPFIEESYDVANTLPEDLAVIYSFFDASARYQEERGYPSWRLYDKDALKRDCDNKLQFKVTVSKEIAMAFSVCYADPVIWRDMENADALYLHRIVVNPAHKGRRLFGVVLDWASLCAKERQLRFVRMDTWAQNNGIIDYYKSFGFDFVEYFTTPNSLDLPSHNRNLALALLQKQVQ